MINTCNTDRSIFKSSLQDLRRGGLLSKNLVTLTKKAYLQGDQYSLLLDFAEHLNIDLGIQQKFALHTLAMTHLDTVSKLLNDLIFPGSLVVFAEDDVISTLLTEIELRLREDERLAIVILDRSIYRSIERKICSSLNDRLGYFSVTNNTKSRFLGEGLLKIPRPGDSSFVQQIEKLKIKLGNYRIAFVDDCYVEGETIRFAERMFQDAGMISIAADCFFFFRVAREFRREDPDISSAVLCLDSLASFEQREFTIFGGTPYHGSELPGVGLQVPSFAPFDDGETLRLKFRLEFKEFSRHIFEIARTQIRDIEDIFGRKITLLDAKRHLPVIETAEWRARCQKSFCVPGLPSILASEYSRINAGFNSDSLLKTTISEYLDCIALKSLNGSAPYKRLVCVDIDGVLLKRKAAANEDIKAFGFKGSILQSTVLSNASYLLAELSGMSLETALAEIIASQSKGSLLAYFMARLGNNLEERYGDLVKEHMHRLVKDCFPLCTFEERESYATKIINSMPLAYHVFRIKVWDLDIPMIYDFDERARVFVANIIGRGALLVFITAAPIIHALKVLKYCGVLDQLKPEELSIFTVEQLYDQTSLSEGKYHELSKAHALLRASELYRVPLEEISMAGDQIEDDVEPARMLGVHAHFVCGPEQLVTYGRSIRLPYDRVDSAV